MSHAAHADAPHDDTHGHDDHGHGDHHVVSYPVLFGVFAALMVLTVITVAVINLDFGKQGNVILAMGIAVVKGFLVAAFFMHLWWDKPFNTLILGFSMFFVALFIGWAILDTGETQDVILDQDWRDRQVENKDFPDREPRLIVP
ncbi:MAG: cytochrome C oxidase subunit IV family protein [Planctomycetota bacterium]